MLVFSTPTDILQSNEMSVIITSIGASRFAGEFRDTSKATTKYLKAIGDKKSLTEEKMTENERITGRCVDASNIISKSLHASSMYILHLGGTVRLDYCGCC